LGASGGWPEGGGGSAFLKIGSEGELGTLPGMPVGAEVEVEENGQRFIGVGSPRREIALRLGWTQDNVWLPQSALSRMLSRRSIFPDLLAAVEALLLFAFSVHTDREFEQGAYFVITGDSLRERGLLKSRTAPFVDGVVESRQVQGGSYLRLFHCGPARRVKGGNQLWP